MIFSGGALVAAGRTCIRPHARLEKVLQASFAAVRASLVLILATVTVDASTGSCIALILPSIARLALAANGTTASNVKEASTAMIVAGLARSSTASIGELARGTVLTSGLAGALVEFASGAANASVCTIAVLTLSRGASLAGATAATAAARVLLTRQTTVVARDARRTLGINLELPTRAVLALKPPDRRSKLTRKAGGTAVRATRCLVATLAAMLARTCAGRRATRMELPCVAVVIAQIAARSLRKWLILSRRAVLARIRSLSVLVSAPCTVVTYPCACDILIRTSKAHKAHEVPCGILVLTLSAHLAVVSVAGILLEAAGCACCADAVRSARRRKHLLVACSAVSHALTDSVTCFACRCSLELRVCAYGVIFALAIVMRPRGLGLPLR